MRTYLHAFLSGAFLLLIFRYWYGTGTGGTVPYHAYERTVCMYCRVVDPDRFRLDPDLDSADQNLKNRILILLALI